MKNLILSVAGLCLVVSGVRYASSQEDTSGPPKVLVIQREYLKPGKGGAMHERSEAAFVRAMSTAKWPVHYFAVESMSGPTRVLFLTGYPSFDAWEKDNLNVAKNTTLMSELDHALASDGELLSSYDQGAFLFHEEGSLRAGVDIAHMRYFEITVFRVRPGHDKEWEELVKMYKEGYEKAVPEAKWALFESVYGADNGGMYLVFNPMRSLVEVEQSYVDEKKFAASMGEERMKKLSELAASCIASQQTNLFRFNPKMSYPVDAWVKADPEFWKPKMAIAPVKKEEAKATAR
ncbi:hypothetical protein [Edaphobacter flagellatus]|uniref:hypothetical protein n=1 Tax=Edaphobacter flagellatus TaxID=1933044 RepID=UPI0021B4463B|nr:hypothetical protein [Edaphobacter flagellatus]